MPEATTENVTLLPAVTVWLTGCVVIVGAVPVEPEDGATTATDRASWPLLEGLDVLILGALRPGKPHPSHFSVEQALDVIARLRPRQAYLTHMAHAIDHDAVSATLPPNVALGYDGLSFPF